jgi:antitoxin component of MazEF toxin-antitoxin module
MGDIFESTIRPLGSSACVLIPKEQLEAEGLKIGDKVEVALLVHRNPEALDKLFGVAKGAGRFERDKKVREFK